MLENGIYALTKKDAAEIAKQRNEKKFKFFQCKKCGGEQYYVCNLLCVSCSLRHSQSSSEKSTILRYSKKLLTEQAWEMILSEGSLNTGDFGEFISDAVMARCKEIATSRNRKKLFPNEVYLSLGEGGSFDREKFFKFLDELKAVHDSSILASYGSDKPLKDMSPQEVYKLIILGEEDKIKAFNDFCSGFISEYLNRNGEK